MPKRFLFAVLGAALPFAPMQPVLAQQKAEPNVAMCVGCHGIPGYKTAFPSVYHVPKIAGQQPAYLDAATARDGVAVATMRHALDRQDDQAFLLSSLARLWLAGVRMDWNAFWAGQRRLRVPLPTYPFERRRYWLEPGFPAMLSSAAMSEMGRASMDEMRPEAVADDARKHLPAGPLGMEDRGNLLVPEAGGVRKIDRQGTIPQ